MLPFLRPQHLLRAQPRAFSTVLRVLAPSKTLSDGHATYDKSRDPSAPADTQTQSVRGGQAQRINAQGGQPTLDAASAAGDEPIPSSESKAELGGAAADQVGGQRGGSAQQGKGESREADAPRAGDSVKQKLGLGTGSGDVKGNRRGFVTSAWVAGKCVREPKDENVVGEQNPHPHHKSASSPNPSPAKGNAAPSPSLPSKDPSNAAPPPPHPTTNQQVPDPPSALDSVSPNTGLKSPPAGYVHSRPSETGQNAGTSAYPNDEPPYTTGYPSIDPKNSDLKPSGQTGGSSASATLPVDEVVSGVQKTTDPDALGSSNRVRNTFAPGGEGSFKGEREGRLRGSDSVEQPREPLKDRAPPPPGTPGGVGWTPGKN